MTNFTGQKLFYVGMNGVRREVGRYVTIKKVGRKWLEIFNENFKVDVKTLDALNKQNGFCCGACYLSEQHYLDIKEKIENVKYLSDQFLYLANDEHRLDKIELGELQNIKQWLNKYK